MPVLTPVRGRLFVALPALAVVLLLAAGCSNDSGGDKTPAAGQTPATGQTPAAGQTPSGAATAEIKMVAGTAFDRAELTIAAGVDVEVSADNTDGTHNFSVYEDESAQENLGKTEICTAPCTETVTLNLPAGEYFFRCDVHTTLMTGTLTAR